ncbi:MAG: hypothetical protein ACYDHH_20185 [Solirubrobacteraceae bacterium]
MSAPSTPGFDPHSILAALQAGSVSSVVIGGLARVARGSDEVTTGVDICPSLQEVNLARLESALAEMGAVRRDGQELVIDETHLRAEQVIELSTAFGELKLIAVPAGVPRGFEALRAGATSEHLGDGLRPEIASTGDLVAMAAALRREADLERLPALRRIMELEADPAALVAANPTPGLRTGAALRGESSHLERSRRRGPGTGPGVGR